MVIKILSDHFELLPQKAIFWKETSTLLISDLHLGKIMHFRKEGISIPVVAIENNFKRLDELLKLYNARRIIFLGDLFHNRVNTEWDIFRKWRMNYSSVEMINILGNHDILPKIFFDEIGITIYKNFFREEDFLFAHHPDKFFEKNTFTFCGHIHPVYFLRSKGRQAIKLSCFVIQESQGILPSFGVFTGGYEIKAEEYKRIFLIVENTIVKV
jgi:DNA ligase-associated metallophosphoesterase